METLPAVSKMSIRLTRHEEDHHRLIKIFLSENFQMSYKIKQFTLM